MKYYHIKFETLNMGGDNRIFEGYFKTQLDQKEIEKLICSVYLVLEIKITEKNSNYTFFENLTKEAIKNGCTIKSSTYKSW